MTDSKSSFEELAYRGTPRTWDDDIIDDFFAVPGRHLGIFGMSGGGKTQSAYQVAIELFNRGETIVWFDTGKSSEVLRLLDLCDLRIIIPEGYGVDIELIKEIPHKFEIVNTVTEAEAIAAIQTGVANVIMLRPFFQDAAEAGRHTASFMSALIEAAKKYQLPPKTVLIIDELQAVAPAQGYELNSAHKQAGIALAHNIDQLRSWGVRIIGMGQNWGKVLKSVRSQFPCLLIRRGVEFYSDESRLSKFNSTFRQLTVKQFIFVFSDRVFTKPLPAPWYGDGAELGTVRYLFDQKKSQ
jgi:hypothetical protein